MQRHVTWPSAGRKRRLRQSGQAAVGPDAVRDKPIDPEIGDDRHATGNRLGDAVGMGTFLTNCVGTSSAMGDARQRRSQAAIVAQSVNHD